MEEYKIVKPQTFEIVGANKFEGVPTAFSVGGANKYFRILIKSIVKDEERDTEIVDEDNKVIYQVPFWMVPSIVERLEYEVMTKDWVKTIDFTGDEYENLSYLELMLWKCGRDDIKEKIRNQRLEKKQPQAFTYEELKKEAIDNITLDAVESEFKRMSPIWKLRNEKIPTIFPELFSLFKSI